MRRALVILLFLVLIGAAVFFVGWVQLSLGPGSYGVIFSKTSDWETDVIVPGTFVWRWQRLIPTNMTLHVFEPRSRQAAARVRGSLPSGGSIEALLEVRNAFDYDVEVLVTWRIRPDELPRLARDEDLLPEDLDSYADSVDAQVIQFARESILQLIEQSADSITLTSASERITESLTSRLERSIPGIEVIAVNPTSVELPDLELYVSAIETVEEIIDARAAALIAAAEDLAAVQAQSDRELLLLERYGQILSEYPVLLEYFRVGQEIGTDPLNIESLIPQPGE